METSVVEADAPPQGGSAGVFIKDWFTHHIPVWQALFAEYLPRPRRILEIGAFEGRATCWMIENLFPADAPGDITCVDTWAGGIEHDGIAMGPVEKRFRSNVDAALRRNPGKKVFVRRGLSGDVLTRLCADGEAGKFDAVYVDGSHQAADVLQDLVLAFRLCRKRGLILCDDYLWQRQDWGKEDVLDTPKVAIDAFTNIYRRKLRVLPGFTLEQLYLQKLTD